MLTDSFNAEAASYAESCYDSVFWVDEPFVDDESGETIYELVSYKGELEGYASMEEIDSKKLRQFFNKWDYK